VDVKVHLLAHQERAVEVAVESPIEIAGRNNPASSRRRRRRRRRLALIQNQVAISIYERSRICGMRSSPPTRLQIYLASWAKATGRYRIR
jgi:hypothetical protein